MALSPKILAMIHDTEPLSASASRLLALMGDDTHTQEDVARIASSDPKLALRVLRTVNSAAFGLRTEVDSIERAVGYLGDKTVLGIALSLGTGGTFRKDLPAYGAGGGDLWAHSLHVAIAARELAKHTRDAVAPDVAYTAGLLHDIGKSLLGDGLGDPDAFIQAETASADGAEGGGAQPPDQVDFDEFERRAMETDHAEVGAALLEAWGLPASLQTAVRHHHAPSESPEADHPLAYVVHLGDFLSMMGGTGTPGDSMRYTLDPAYADWVRLAPRELDRIHFDVQQEFARTRRAMEGDT